MINEAPVRPPSAMTPEQRRQAEAAILGLPASTADPNEAFTPEQIEFMRTRVAQHDSHVRTREFDLNNPPKRPYKFQAYPMMLYHHEDRTTRVVHSREQEEGLLSLGYSHEPFPNAAVEAPRLDAQTQAEVERLDALAKAKKAK